MSDDQSKQQEQEIRSQIEFSGSFDETVSNGKAIDWRYWMSMKTLSAGQAARLMVGLDPDIFEDLSAEKSPKNDTSAKRERAKKIERLALNIGIASSAPAAWLKWAKEQQFNIHRLFELEVTDSAINSAEPKPDGADLSLERCKALAAMEQLTNLEWEELTGVGIDDGDSYACGQQGIFPRQYSDEELRLLSREESRTLRRIASLPPLVFPCTPTELLAFVDDERCHDFELPDEFRDAVMALTCEQKADKNQQSNRGADIPQEQKRTRDDGLCVAMLAGRTAYRDKHQTEPTARALFNWLSTNDETGNIVDFDVDKDIITWRCASEGGLRDTTFRTFQGRYTGIKKLNK